MWSGSGSERTRSITGLNFRGGPSVAPNPLRGECSKEELLTQRSLRMGRGHLIKKDSSEFSGIL